MNRSLRKTTSIAWSHHGCEEMEARKEPGTARSSHPLKKRRIASTQPLQSRYCPRKNAISVHQRGRKNGCFFAGNTFSSGQNKAIKNSRLSPVPRKVSGIFILFLNQSAGSAPAQRLPPILSLGTPFVIWRAAGWILF